MSKLWIVKYVFLSFITITPLLCANEDQEVAESICRHAYTSISQIEEGKIFLKSNKLHFYEGQIYLEDINGGGIAIPAIFSCARGLYVKTDGANIFNLWQCKKCSYWNHNYDDPIRCRRCKKPRSN